MGADLTMTISNKYFRDSYNSTSILWQYNLSWWHDVAKLLNEDGNLTPETAQKLLNRMEENEDDFELNMAQMAQGHNKHLDYHKDYHDQTGHKYVYQLATFEDIKDRAELVEFFREKAKTFHDYLKEAVDTSDNISCSI